ncbi:MAG: Maf-like protein [Patescibacteria group bacterium]
MLILASTSPRRREILSEITTEFEVVESNFVEKINSEINPNQVVLDLAYGKGREVLGRYPEDVIIAGDTVVYHDFTPIGKAKSKHQAWEMLRSFSGSQVQIYTATAILTKSKILIESTCANVIFNTISSDFIEAYLDDTEADWMDKAGAFAVQGKAASFTHVEGEWSTAVGLSKNFLEKNLPGFLA